MCHFLPHNKDRDKFKGDFVHKTFQYNFGRSIKILVITPGETDANSFWRCVGPMSYFEKFSNGLIQVKFWKPKEPLSWADMIQYDVLFLHRPCRPEDVTLLKIAYQLNIPVWVDYDDHLFKVPGWNPTAHFYQNHSVQDSIAQCIACADVISVSTEALKDELIQVNPNVVVVPNAYRSDLFTYRSDRLEERVHIGYWRGSNTHDADLLSVKDGFNDIGSKIYFIGAASWMFFSGLNPETYSILGSMDNLIFNRHIYEMRPKVMIYPLVNCLFNRCKSNIAYIEAMHAGAICVAPHLPEWRKPGVINYEPHDSFSFRSKVKEAFSVSEENHQSILKEAYEEMKKNYDISIVNKIRLSILDNLTNDLFKKNVKNPFIQIHALEAMSVLKSKKD